MKDLRDRAIDAGLIDDKGRHTFCATHHRDDCHGCQDAFVSRGELQADLAQAERERDSRPPITLDQLEELASDRNRLQKISHGLHKAIGPLAEAVAAVQEILRPVGGPLENLSEDRVVTKNRLRFGPVKGS